MMDDLIRRQDALKVSTMDSEIYLAINNLPSANTDMSGYSDKLWTLAHERGIREAQQQWVPCTERRPDKTGQYLITDRYRNVYKLVYKVDFDQWIGGGSPPIAWMPLPEPYTEDINDG